MISKDEMSHNNHTCSANSVAFTTRQELVSVDSQNFDSLIPISITNMPKHTPGSKYKRAKGRNTKTRPNSFFKYFCSKCKEAYEEHVLYREHPCVSGKTAEKQEEPTSEEDKANRDEYLKYQCFRCQLIFDNIPYEDHPCFLKKGLPVIKSIKQKNFNRVESAEGLNVDTYIKSEESNTDVQVDGGLDIGVAETTVGLNADKVKSGYGFNIVDVMEGFDEPIDESSHSVKGSDADIVGSTAVPDNDHDYSTSLVLPSENIQDPTITIFDIKEVSTKDKKQKGKREVKPTPWQCNVCNKYFKVRYYLVNHSCFPPDNLPRGVLGDPPYRCPRCQKVYKHKQSFSRHWRHECKMLERPEKIIPPLPSEEKKAQAPKKKFYCPVCNKGFNQKYYITHHSCEKIIPRPHGTLGGPPFLCSACGVVYNKRSSFTRHINHECGRGRMFYKTYSGKYAGKTKKKPAETLLSNVCILCNTDFPDQNSLEAHVQSDHLSL